MAQSAPNIATGDLYLETTSFTLKIVTGVIPGVIGETTYRYKRLITSDDLRRLNQEDARVSEIANQNRINLGDTTSRLDTEIRDRTAGDAANSQAIMAEAATRGGADTALGGRIDDEIQARTQADTCLLYTSPSPRDS